MATDFRTPGRACGNLRSVLSDLSGLDFGEPMVGAHRAAIWRTLRELVLLIESCSPRQQGHGRRTADLAHRIGLAAEMAPEELVDLTLAALLHDIGLLTLPPPLMDQREELSPREFARYQSHPRAGAELLESISFLRRPALWIAHHHERWDGCGYPYGLRGEFIPLGARILAVADAYDSFACPAESSGQMLDVPAIIGLLRVFSGSHLDPALVERCIDIVSSLSFADALRSAPA